MVAMVVKGEVTMGIVGKKGEDKESRERDIYIDLY